MLWSPPPLSKPLNHKCSIVAAPVAMHRVRREEFDMRWFQVVVALLGGVLCEGLRVLLYLLDAMPYDGGRPYTLPTPLLGNVLVLAPVVVIPVLAVVVRLLGARWSRSVSAAFVTYIGGVATYQFTRSLRAFSPFGGYAFQRHEVQVLTLLVGGVILCIGLVMRNPAYPRWTLAVLIGACFLGYQAAVNRGSLVGYGNVPWFYPATYIVTCTIYGLILALAWRKPVNDLGTGTYRLGKGDAAPAAAPERPLS